MACALGIAFNKYSEEKIMTAGIKTENMDTSENLATVSMNTQQTAGERLIRYPTIMQDMARLKFCMNRTWNVFIK